MPKHTFEIERVSPCPTWVERFLVEVNAATLGDARAQVASSLEDSERIVPGIHLRLVASNPTPSTLSGASASERRQQQRGELIESALIS